MIELKDKVAVVTGASSGLGRRFALALSARGAVVVGLARRGDLLEQLAVQSTVVCDVTDIERFCQVLSEVEERHGRIDILINNAGIGEPASAPKDITAFRPVMETNYFAPVASSLAVVPGMRRRGEGVIVNVSSDSGRAPTSREMAYAASKAALSAFSESLSFALDGSGVHVHVLYPGWVPTQMGTAAVDDNQMPPPPRFVRRTEEQVSRLLLSRMGGPRLEIDATRVARLAPVARTLFPIMYRRGVKKAAGG